MVGNKSDLRHLRAVRTEEGESFASKYLMFELTIKCVISKLKINNLLTKNWELFKSLLYKFYKIKILNDFKFSFSLPRQNKNWGGSRDKLVNELTVHPKYSFFEVPLVIIVTPVEKREKTEVRFCLFFIINMMVALERLELSRGCPHRILNPARLPFRHNALNCHI